MEELERTHNLDKIVIVGDRRNLSTKNIENLVNGHLHRKLDESYLYASALCSTQNRHLIGDGSIQLGPLDVSNLFEVTLPDYPGERLIDR